jgi:hypothetical protein
LLSSLLPLGRGPPGLRFELGPALQQADAFDIVKADDHDLELHPALLVTATQATAWRQNNSIFIRE